MDRTTRLLAEVRAERPGLVVAATGRNPPMLGHSHALSGAATGLAAGIMAGLPAPQTGVLAGFTTGMALLPDLDSVGACASRSLGFLSESVAVVIRFVSGGHRHGTHEPVGVAVFTAVACLAYAYRRDPAGMACLALLTALATAGALDALHLTDKHFADMLGIVAGAAVAFEGVGARVIPVAVLLGCVTHIAGDMLTESGCMVAMPLSRHRFHLLPGPLQFTTGTLPEYLIIDPALTALVAVLAFRVTDPVLAARTWHEAVAAL